MPWENPTLMVIHNSLVWNLKVGGRPVVFVMRASIENVSYSRLFSLLCDVVSLFIVSRKAVRHTVSSLCHAMCHPGSAVTPSAPTRARFSTSLSGCCGAPGARFSLTSGSHERAATVKVTGVPFA